jgi:hypothetical protein
MTTISTSKITTTGLSRSFSVKISPLLARNRSHLHLLRFWILFATNLKELLNSISIWRGLQWRHHRACFCI